MRNIQISAPRERETLTRVQNGQIAFDVNPFFAQLPEALQFAPIVSACCDNENIYLLSRSYEHPIIRLDLEGAYISDFGRGLFRQTHDIISTSEGTLIVVDADAHAAYELDKQGTVLRVFGNPGHPSDSGYDANAYRKKQLKGQVIANDIGYDANWAFAESIRTILRAAPPFNKPTGIAQAENGKLFFSDGYANAAVHRFNREGGHEKTFGGPETLMVPHAICADTAGRLWVADREGNAITVFSQDGEVLAKISGNFMQPTDLFATRDEVYVAERGGGLSVFDMHLQLVTQLGYYRSPLIVHGMCSLPDRGILLLPLGSNYGQSVVKLTRIQ